MCYFLFMPFLDIAVRRGTCNCTVADLDIQVQQMIGSARGKTS
jgi:hypothetical protein